MKAHRKSALSLRVSDIRQEGRIIRETIPVAPLNARIQEGSPSEIQVLSDPEVELNCAHRLAGVGLGGSIRFQLSQDCSSCAKALNRTETVPFEIECKELPTEGADRNLPDDVGVHFYEHDHIDLEDLLQERIILSLSPFYRPDLDKDGRCSACGQVCTLTRSESTGAEPGPSKQSLGALLTKAGVRGRS